MYRFFRVDNFLWMSLQSLRRRSLLGTSSRTDDGRARATIRASRASSKIALESFAAAASSASAASAALSRFFGGIAGGMETRRRGDARRGDGSTLVRVRLARRSFESEGDSIQK